MDVYQLQVIYICIGVISGVLAGLLGVGGGVFVVPALVLLLPADLISADILMHMTLGTSLAIIAFTAFTSTLLHHRRGHIQWRLLMILVPGLALGSGLGGLIGNQLESRLLQWFFALYAITAATHITLVKPLQAHLTVPKPLGLSLFGILFGFLSSLLGIGGGAFIVPFFNWCNLKMKHAVGTSAACGLAIAVVGASSYAWVGLEHPSLPQYSTGYIFWPAFLSIAPVSVLCVPMGVWLSCRLSALALKRTYAVLFLLVGLHMLFRA